MPGTKMLNYKDENLAGTKTQASHKPAKDSPDYKITPLIGKSQQTMRHQSCLLNLAMLPALNQEYKTIVSIVLFAQIFENS